VSTAYLFGHLKRNDRDPAVGPDTLNAWQGFEALDYETVWDPPRGTVYTPDTPVVGSIQNVHGALREMGLRAPAPIDYPEALAPWFGRKVERTTIGEVMRSRAPVFVKPCACKAFTGFVWTGSEGDHYTVMHLLDDGDGDPVWRSEVVDFRSEWRVFVHRGEVVGIRGYKGEPLGFPDAAAVRAMVAAWAGAPVAYALDVGVVADGRTLLVETNDCYALGSYDLRSDVYARMLADRWREMTA
jgi:hypothetical protein